MFDIINLSKIIWSLFSISILIRFCKYCAKNYIWWNIINIINYNIVIRYSIIWTPKTAILIFILNNFLYCNIWMKLKIVNIMCILQIQILFHDLRTRIINTHKLNFKKTAVFYSIQNFIDVIFFNKNNINKYHQILLQ